MEHFAEINRIHVKSSKKSLAGFFNGESVALMYDRSREDRVKTLLTQPMIIIYYCLAAYFSFGFAGSQTQSSQSISFCVLRCLPLLYLITYVIWSKAFTCSSHGYFSKYVLLGLVLSCVGEFLLQLDADHFMNVVCLYSAVHLFYTGGLYIKYKGSSLAWLIIPLDVLIMAAMYVILTGFVSAMIFFGYGIVTMAMTFLAVSRFERERTAPAYLGVAGSFLQQMAHACLALSEFSPAFCAVVTPDLVMMVSYLAALGIGLSAHFC